MNVEGIPSVEDRARKHAALADPARLRMLDMLTYGDLTPTELREELGLPSNLVAHHLGVLEREGIIARTRSEGDRRRSYVRLIPSALPELGFTAAAGAERVVFVCSHNSARSQLARALWTGLSPVPAESAGTHPAAKVASGAIAAAARHGLDLTGAVPQLVEDVVTETDFVITVCDRAHEEYRAGTVHWSVPDPVIVGTDAAFEAAFADLAARVEHFSPRLLALA
ncbi:helix-turn-helix domain-containing protein [Microbacterium sp. ASV81]|uniref:Helix-turn-helix domain-containing protein n=1 Tax=Microbacterium capsulatum TaxID=3041921 RepID=A0ABU0XDB6_9MICO|nr:helix-turn-helix domain-containing protein [Microbacterium sp. ASV81]MDQ4213073.1 helix-turn-helix domain-containing protein [Microbacterium sp. ASV81]